jgi:decaprenyl-phosphate phosphoribosyltransferase
VSLRAREHRVDVASAPSRSKPALPVRAFVRTCRLRQWVKNLLVFAVPAAAGALGDRTVMADALLAFAALSLASSGTYLLNDAADAAADRLHPTKRTRPVAAGALPVRAAVVGGIALIGLALVIASVSGLGLLGVVAGYVALTTAYTHWLKHQPIFDIAAVAAGFFLRAVAGGVASDLTISRWFLIVAGGGSLFLVTAKRYAELRAFGDDAHQRRAALAHYSQDYLRAILSTTAGVTVLAYCLWAFEGTPANPASGWTALSAVPFVLGMMRYGLLVDQGHGEEPEEIVFGDRVLQAIGGVWLMLLIVGVIA